MLNWKWWCYSNEKGDGDDDGISGDNGNDHDNCDDDFNDDGDDEDPDDDAHDDDEREVCNYNAQMQSYVLCGLPEQCITLSWWWSIDHDDLFMNLDNFQIKL